MKKQFTFLVFTCLMMGAATISAQLMDVVTGVEGPVALEINGNELFISERPAGKISKIDLNQTDPIITDLVTNLNSPSGMRLVGDELYISEGVLGKVVKVNITETNPIPVDVVDDLISPTDLIIVGNELYIAQYGAGSGTTGFISKISLTTANPILENVFTDLAGPNGFALKGNDLFVSQSLAGTVSKVDLSASELVLEELVSGLVFPKGLNVNGDFLYITETNGSRIVRIDLTETSPSPELIISGLQSPQQTLFDGLQLLIPQRTADKVSKFVLNQTAFTDLGTVCSNEEAFEFGGGLPAGGVYEGEHVTDNGNGTSFTFDIATAGVGMFTVTYTVLGITNSSTITIVDPATGSFTATEVVDISQGVQSGLGGAMPTGGIYSGVGVSDDGNGMTYSFDPEIAGLGTTIITYDFIDNNGCTGAVSDDVLVVELPGNICAEPNDINPLFGQMVNVPQVSGIWDNTYYTSTATDPITGYECFGESDGMGSGPSLERTIWYNFTGDGERYKITTIPCNSINYIGEGNTQIALYSGTCLDPIAVMCNEDDPTATDLRAAIEIETEEGIDYLLMIDGFGPDLEQMGEFCVEVTQLEPNAVTQIEQTDIKVFPNPTSGQLYLENVDADQVEILDNLGRTVLVKNYPGNQIDMTHLTAGFYFLKIKKGSDIFIGNIVKE